MSLSKNPRYDINPFIPIGNPSSRTKFLTLTTMNSPMVAFGILVPRLFFAEGRYNTYAKYEVGSPRRFGENRYNVSPNIQNISSQLRNFTFTNLANHPAVVFGSKSCKSQLWYSQDPMRAHRHPHETCCERRSNNPEIDLH